MTKTEEELLLNFMTVTFEKINQCLAHIYALQKIILENKLATQNQLINTNYEAMKLPDRKIGIDALKDMINEFNKGVNNGKENVT